MDGAYWSIEHCAWVTCSRTPDALATPWSAHGLTVRPAPAPLDGDDLLRARRSGPLPGQRPAAVPAEVHAPR